MILYLDTSALIKRYVREPGSDGVHQLIEQAELTGSVSIAMVEIAAGLAKGVRQNWVQAEAARSAWADFLQHWPAFVRLHTAPAMLERAAALAWEYGLRGYDALHLAAGLSWRDALDTPVTFASFDWNLNQAARKAGLKNWPIL